LSVTGRVARVDIRDEHADQERDQAKSRKPAESHIPLQCRLVGERAWSKGTTENISSSGVLFRAERVIQPQARLEINLVLPEEISGLSTAEVICGGEVVRTMPEPPTVNAALAAIIILISQEPNQ
jgi:hypothetical protein